MPPEPATQPTASGLDRPAILAALLDEMTNFSPAGAMHKMRHWPAGRLSLVHVNVLMVLDAEGPLGMRGLAEALDVSQASATGIVDRMEQRGLVERRRDAEDRRVIRVAVAEPGRQLIAGFADDRRSHLETMFDAMTDDELAGFLVGARGMRRVREAFHARQAATSGGDPAATSAGGNPAATSAGNPAATSGRDPVATSSDPAENPNETHDPRTTRAQHQAHRPAPRPGAGSIPTPTPDTQEATR